ncbi:MAG TPA: ABC transporter ATP-binding protein [Geobacteraceae bacterium]
MSGSDRYLLSVENIAVQLLSAGRVVRAVDGVSFSIERGQTLAIVGESGSGKSMLCRAIMGILPRCAVLSDEGRILFDGHNLGALPDKKLNTIRGKEIGIVLQDPLSSLNPVVRVGRQIAEPLVHHSGVSFAKAKKRAIELLYDLGMPHPRERVECYPHQLSGGMRQRVAIAIALACEPKLLIADEPTTALDVTIQAEILDLLGRLQVQRGMAMILVTHNLGVVAGRAHKTAVMYAGRIVECGPTETIFTKMRMHYTRALFDAIPHINDPPHRDLEAIQGLPPDLAELPPGCRFAPRCRRAEGQCFAQSPPLINDSDGHCYACWFPLQLEERT